jgi:hypothetical protein
MRVREREADFDEPADLWGCKPASRDAFLVGNRELHRLCLLPKKKYCANKRFPVTSNLRYMHGVLNVDKIKN